jgi:hypothetical protein
MTSYAKCARYRDIEYQVMQSETGYEFFIQFPDGEESAEYSTEEQAANHAQKLIDDYLDCQPNPQPLSL